MLEADPFIGGVITVKEAHELPAARCDIPNQPGSLGTDLQRWDISYAAPLGYLAQPAGPVDHGFVLVRDEYLAGCVDDRESRLVPLM